MAELREGIKELKERQKEIDKLIETLTVKTDAAIEKLRERQEKTDAQMRETDEQMKKTDERIAKRDTEIDKLLKTQEKFDERIKKLTDGWGSFVEGYVRPNVYTLFESLGIHITGTISRITRHLNGDTMEIDIIAIGSENKKENIIIVVEISSHLTIGEVKSSEKKLPRFFKFFPEYKDKKLNRSSCRSSVIPWR